MAECIDVHTHIVPENFPPYAGKNANVPWPSMAEAQACHRHVMISGKLYRTVADGSWSVPRRIEQMGEMQVTRQAISYAVFCLKKKKDGFTETEPNQTKSMLQRLLDSQQELT